MGYMEFDDDEARDVPGVDSEAINERKRTTSSESVPDQGAGPGTGDDAGGGTAGTADAGGASQGGGSTGDAGGASQGGGTGNA